MVDDLFVSIRTSVRMIAEFVIPCAKRQHVRKLAPFFESMCDGQVSFEDDLCAVYGDSATQFFAVVTGRRPNRRYQARARRARQAQGRCLDLERRDLAQPPHPARRGEAGQVAFG